MRRKNNPKKRLSGRVIGLALGVLFGVCVMVVCVLGSARLSAMYGSVRAQLFVITHVTPTQKPLGVYEWRHLQDIVTTDDSAMLTDLHRHGYNTLYLAIDDALIAPDQAAYQTQLAQFIDRASKAGLQVWGLAGDPSWVASNNTGRSVGVLQFAAHFNATQSAKLAGLSFDIEPYSQQTMTASKFSTALLPVIDALGQETQQNNLSLPLNITLPFWARADDALLTHISRLPHNSITVMAYRNHTDGPDGSIALATPLVAAAGRLRMPVYIAQDITRQTPAKITFYLANRTTFRAHLYALDAAFTHRQNYRGIIINDLQNLEIKKP